MTTLRHRRLARRRVAHRFTAMVAGAARFFAVLIMAAAWLMLAPVGRAVAAGGSFVAPLPVPLTVLQPFSLPGAPWLPGNRGVDFAASAGEPVVAAAAGKVLYAGALAGRGVVSIDHGTMRTTYEPVDPVVHAGDVVAQGNLIGRVANTADACGPPGSCLHWGAITADGYVDPMQFVDRPTIRLLPIWGNGLLPGVMSQSQRAPADATATTTTGRTAVASRDEPARKEPSATNTTAPSTAPPDRWQVEAGIASTAGALMFGASRRTRKRSECAAKRR